MALLVLASTAAMASSEVRLMQARIDIDDDESLQRGARTFVNYCLSCHSASYMRYNRVAKDLKIPESIVKSNLMFTTDKIGNGMRVAMRDADSERWFGVTPPDLSVIARARGEDWLYTFLLSFYLDPKSPTGVNNLVFKDTAMPHVLWQLQGWQRPIHSEGHGGEGTVKHLELDSEGVLDENEYEHTVRDLVNFMVYMAEPVQRLRLRMGKGVLIFLGLFIILTYALKREYWRDIH